MHAGQLCHDWVTRVSYYTFNDFPSPRKMHRYRIRTGSIRSISLSVCLSIYLSIIYIERERGERLIIKHWLTQLWRLRSPTALSASETSGEPKTLWHRFQSKSEVLSTRSTEVGRRSISQLSCQAESEFDLPPLVRSRQALTGERTCFTQSSNSNAPLFQKHLPRHTQRSV